MIMEASRIPGWRLNVAAGFIPLTAGLIVLATN
jgi:hypothetical protein